MTGFNRWLLAMVLGALCALPLKAEELSKGQTIYLPIYSHIWYGDLDASGQPRKALMSALVSIRNTSLKMPVRVTSARYYSTEGRLLKEFAASPRTVPPMATLEFFVEKSESAGGSGANFIIQWEASTETNSPLVEAVHTDIQLNRTPTFLASGRAINQSSRSRVV